MWDNHWCKGATQRVGVLAEKMDPVLAQARKMGILIIHAPSETMDFYKDTPQRKLMLALEQGGTAAGPGAHRSSPADR